MKPAPFTYHRARQIDQALSLLKKFGEDAKILAGGQSLMPLLNFRLAQPDHLIDINFIDGLDYIRKENGRIKIGSLTRQSRLLDEPLITESCPLLAEAAAFVGYSQTRNRGTFCGSLAHADPAAEFPAVLLALGGTVTASTSSSKRVIAADDFFRSYLMTALSPDEMILEASIPEIPAGAGCSFVEFARRFGDFAIVGVATVLVDDGDKITNAKIVLTGVGEKPWRQHAVEEMLAGAKASDKLFNRIGAEVAARINPDSDIHASASYRRTLAEVLTRRALAAAWRRAKK